MKRTALLLAIAILSCSTAEKRGSVATSGTARSAERGTVVVSERARELHAGALVFDGHNDLPGQMLDRAGNDFTVLDISVSQPELHTDIPRLRAGGLGAQFWSVWVPADTEEKGAALIETLTQIDCVRRMVSTYPDVFEVAYTADDVERIHAAGKIASMMGVEGGYGIESSLPVLRIFFDLGVRYMTLTHSDTTAWADSATDEPEHGGLSEFGEEVVREMNRLGMLVDISHVSVQTMDDALRVSAAPVIASHSCAHELAPHPRNIPGDVLRKVADGGGVVMVNFYSGFVVRESALAMRDAFDVWRQLREEHPDDDDFRAATRKWREENPIASGTVHDVVDHIEHIVKVAGVDHVGLGSDYDGVGQLPTQLEDVSCYPFVTQVLLDRGYSDEDVLKILGGNAVRALREAENVARSLRQG